MTRKKLKTINLKSKKTGKVIGQYVQVHERLRYLREDFEGDYSLTSEVLPTTVGDRQAWKVKATLQLCIGEKCFTYTGHALEIVGDNFINKTSALENAECMPIDTQILTKRGYKYYHQVKLGEPVLTFNVDNGLSEWKPIKKISVWENQPVIEASTSRFKARFTPKHKWAVWNGSKTELIEFDKIDLHKRNNKIILSAPESKSTTGNKIDASMLGWFFTDSEISYTKNGLIGRIQVRQSKEKNLPELNRMFGTPKQINHNSDVAVKWKPAYAWSVPVEEVRRVCRKFGVNTEKDLVQAVLDMDIMQVRSFYNAAMKADGDSGGFGKCKEEVVEAIQICCNRLGIKTGKQKVKWMKNSTKPFYYLPIHKTSGAYTSELKIRNLPPRTVWCPTTENGTWFAKQEGQTFITGNTSAWGRACAAAGIGVDESIASAEEVANARASNGAGGKKLLNKQLLTTMARELAKGNTDVFDRAKQKGYLVTEEIMEKVISDAEEINA